MEITWKIRNVKFPASSLSSITANTKYEKHIGDIATVSIYVGNIITARSYNMSHNTICHIIQYVSKHIGRYCHREYLCWVYHYCALLQYVSKPSRAIMLQKVRTEQHIVRYNLLRTEQDIVLYNYLQPTFCDTLEIQTIMYEC